MLNVYRYQKLFLIPRGACPFCFILLNREACSDTPIHKVLRLNRETIAKLVEFVKRHVK